MKLNILDYNGHTLIKRSVPQAVYTTIICLHTYLNAKMLKMINKFAKVLHPKIINHVGA